MEEFAVATTGISKALASVIHGGNHKKAMKMLDIPEEYKTLRPHIALERADVNMDEEVFRVIIKAFPMLDEHIVMTTPVFGEWNFKP